MASSENPRNCDYVRVDNSPHTFAAKLGELSHINEQVAQIDNHIHELSKLRSALLHRSNQLRSPVYAIPNDVVLSIFLQLNDSETSGSWNLASLRQALTLCSVSTQWRHIVLGTQAFWRKIDLHVKREQRPVRFIASLIEHCASRTQSLNVSLTNHVHDEDAADYLRPITRVLSSSDTSQSIKALTLSGLPPDWAPLLPSFSLLNALSIQDDIKNEHGHIPRLELKQLELGGLRSLSRVHIHVDKIHSITLPPSVEDFHLITSSSHLIIPVLYKCPNLRALEYENKDSSTAVSFPEPLNLSNLKKLVWLANVGVETMESAQNLRIPAVEYLELTQCSADSSVVPAAIIAFCHQGWENLSSLILHHFSQEWSITLLRQLFRHPLPNLQTLELRRWSYQALLGAVHALTPPESTHDNSAMVYAPLLQFLTLGDNMGFQVEDPTPFLRALVALFKNRKAGVKFPFHLSLLTYFTTEHDLKKLPQPLRDELKLIVNSRQVKITRWNRSIPWLVPPSI